MSTKLVDTSSMRTFPIASRMLGVNTSKSASSSLPHFSKIPNPSVVMKIIFEFLSYAIPFVAALYVNLVGLRWSLSLVSPQLPIACQWVFGVGCASLLFIGYLERNVEEAWKMNMRKNAALDADAKAL